MRRRRRRPLVTIDEADLRVVLMLQVGASEDELRRSPGLERELRALWEAVGHALLPSPTCPDGFGDTLADAYRCPPGTRPWAWWHFNLGREMPATEADQLRDLKALGLFIGSWEESA